MTTVGDITAWPTPVREMPIALNTPRIVSFGEVRAMATRRNLLKDRINAALHAPTTENWRIGISPHAPYSIELEGYQRCLDAAKEYDLALTTHLAETPDETEFLAHHTGPLREIWNAIGGWDEQVPKFEGGPIRFAHSIGLLDYPKGSLAHVNYCDDDELVILTRGKASVIYCPRTHQYFEHPPHRWREMLARGINVAIGTDSCASSPNLNLVDDLRLLHEIAPEVPVQTLWEMATIRAARAIAMDDLVGSITPGKRADFCIFKAASKKPLLGILECDATPSAMFIGGTDIPVGDRTR
jgi:cytosine/adenosine deaminase-related metal-dependent hydrolase